MTRRAVRLRLPIVEDQAPLLEEVRELLRRLDAKLAELDAHAAAQSHSEIDLLLRLPDSTEATIQPYDKPDARGGGETSGTREPLSLRRLYETLTAREREVYSLVVRGLLNKQIAACLDITERTVKAHRARVMQKMRAASLAELTRFAVSLGV